MFLQVRRQFQSGSKTAPNRLEMPPRCLKTVLKRSKTASRRFQDGQESSIASQGGSSQLQDVSK